MSSHPKTFFGPAVVCEPFLIPVESEWTGCAKCSKERNSGFCPACGSKVETRTVTRQETNNPWDLHEETEFLEYIPYEQRIEPSVHYFAEAIVSIDNDYEEAAHIIPLDDLEKIMKEFKVARAKDIAMLNAHYKGKTRVELVLLSYIR